MLHDIAPKTAGNHRHAPVVLLKEITSPECYVAKAEQPSANFGYQERQWLQIDPDHFVLGK